MTQKDGIRLHLIKEKTGAAVDLVFFHGLGGHFEKTWTHANGFSWTKQLDTLDQSARIWSLQYPASKFRWTKEGKRAVGTIKSLARDVRLEFAAQRSIGLMAHQNPCIWVCHSLGGLIAKRLLVDNEKASRAGDKISDELLQGLMFLGTPHRGSQFSDWGQSIFGGVKSMVGIATGTLAEALGWQGPLPSDLAGYMTELVSELEDRNDGLWDLDKEFQSYFQARWSKEKPLYVSVLAEGRGPLVLGAGPCIVDERSADPGLRISSTDEPVKPRVMSRLDHVGLSKPENEQSAVFRYLQELRYRVSASGDRYTSYLKTGSLHSGSAVWHLAKQLDWCMHRRSNLLDHWRRVTVLGIDPKWTEDRVVTHLVSHLVQGGSIDKIALTSLNSVNAFLSLCPCAELQLAHYADEIMATLLGFCAAPQSEDLLAGEDFDSVSYPGYSGERELDALFLRAAQAQHKLGTTQLPKEGDQHVSWQDLNGLSPTTKTRDLLERWVYGTNDGDSLADFANRVGADVSAKLSSKEQKGLESEVNLRSQTQKYLLVDARTVQLSPCILDDLSDSTVQPILSIVKRSPADCDVEEYLKRAWTNYVRARAKHLEPSSN